ncbi:MAG: EndoU domain-containing protein [Candidatus Babeliales bacterium]
MGYFQIVSIFILLCSIGLHGRSSNVIEHIRATEHYFKKQLGKYKREISANIGLVLSKNQKHIAHEGVRVDQLNMRHIALGNLNKKQLKLTGLHTDQFCPEKIKKVIIPPNEKGIWLGQWKDERSNLAKISSFFPSLWSASVIVDNIIESLAHIKGIKLVRNGVRILGKTSNDINIELFIKPDGTIQTAFPRINPKKI